MRELIVAVTFALLLMVPFLIFVVAGWPGAPDSCVTESPNACYCEAFDTADVGNPGVRQPFNTWSNLYSLLTGGFLAFVIWWNRRNGLPSCANRIRCTHAYPLVYIPVVIFLGLGSMWFHASLIGWGGIIDQLSMYAFVGFILVYTIVRMTNRDWPFYFVYPAAVLVLTVLGGVGVPSFILIGIIVIAYLVLEVLIWARYSQVRNSLRQVFAYWLPGALAMLAAVGVWIPAQTGGPLCNPDATFQWHAVWHWLAGATAVFLYFYWRSARR